MSGINFSVFTTKWISNLCFTTLSFYRTINCLFFTIIQVQVIIIKFQNQSVSQFQVVIISEMVKITNLGAILPATLYPGTYCICTILYILQGSMRICNCRMISRGTRWSSLSFMEISILSTFSNYVASVRPIIEFPDVV